MRGGSSDSIAAVSIRWIKRAMTSSNCPARFRAHCGTVSLLAKNNAARKFYEAHGFTAVKSNPLHLYLPLNSIRKLCEE